MSTAIETLSPARETDWDHYVDAHPESTCYHHRAWQVAAGKAYPVENQSLVALNESGQVAGVLPLFVVRRPWSSYGVTAVLGGYGRVLGDSLSVRQQLLEEARSRASRLRLTHLLHKSVGEEEVGAGWGRGDAAVTATLSLAPGETALWEGFRGEIRNRVRKAQASGLRVHEGAVEFDAFYDVLAANMHRKGTPIYGRPFLREVLAAFGGRAAVMTVRRGSEAIGGALVVEHNGVVNVPFVSSLPSAFSLAPNNLLYWEIVKRGCARGMTELDFGRSFKDTSNLEFKRRWGARTIPQPFYFVHRGAPPIIEPGSPLVRRLVGLWQALPSGLAAQLGPILAGHLLL